MLQHRLETGDGPGALSTARRIAKILKLAIAQMDVLETLTPPQFARFRPGLGSSSGFQSYQFRRIEAAFGRRHFGKTSDDPVREEIMGRRSVFESLLCYLNIDGWPVPADVLNRDPREPWPGDADVRALLAKVYENAGTPAGVCEVLLDIDEGIQEWRYRHVKAVERIIGWRVGDGRIVWVAISAKYAVPEPYLLTCGICVRGPERALKAAAENHGSRAFQCAHSRPSAGAEAIAAPGSCR